jgi:hypothetical protein
MLKSGHPSAHELQRHKVLTQSFYGIWSDIEKTIELKISPRVGGARIKIWTVNDFSIIKKISLYCGLASSPKRTHWEGFDLITNLEKDGDDSFVNGVVNMPNTRRRNLAEFRVSGNLASLDFFSCEAYEKEVMQNKSGSIILTQKR